MKSHGTTIFKEIDAQATIIKQVYEFIQLTDKVKMSVYLHQKQTVFTYL